MQNGGSPVVEALVSKLCMADLAAELKGKVVEVLMVQMQGELQDLGQQLARRIEQEALQLIEVEGLASEVAARMQERGCTEKLLEIIVAKLLGS